ncbi:MFS transporter [Paenibacillus sp. JX-17]|uniref:MFS transporter n=1 Tax=Paenibacillus lacisoli TaxID=3064525 RepID=A0ABT9CF81_9BACL|nr:MFS transporter [Paenibacillus sp. JX-17]MDO7907934.1 MFS transporter [Paenibacillus sp. JX-17]
MSTNSQAKTQLSASITLLLAAACGIIVANLYYAQPLVELIRSSIGLSAGAAGLIVTLTQIGYGLGLLFIVPLGDILENRRLIVTSLTLAVAALIMTALAGNAAIFLIASFLIGLGSVSAQILVPFAAHLAPEATRGRAVGNVMSGLLLGIMLARPVASLVTDLLGWQAIFWISAGFILILMLVLAKLLPHRQPTASIAYRSLLSSMRKLAVHTPILRRRALYHACVFAAFSLFWTTVPMILNSRFHLSQTGIAIYALVGVFGAIASPIAGRIADRGWVKAGTAAALALVIVSLLLSVIVQGSSILSLLVLVVAAVLLDMGVSANLVLGQRSIFSLGDELRSRLNGIYMATFFLGGAVGSAVGGWAYAHGGWSLACWIGVAFPCAALLYFMTERKQAH